MKSAWHWVLIPSIVLHILAGVYALTVGDWYLKDSLEYGYAADNLIEAGRLYAGSADAPFRTEYLSKRPPVYPLLLAGVRLLTGGDGLMLVIQAALGVFCLWLSCRLILKIHPGFRHWAWLTPFIVLYPAQYIYANLIMTELWLQAMLLAMTYALWCAWEKKSLLWFWVYTGLLVVGILTKPVLYVFVLPNVIIVCVYAWKWRSLGYVAAGVVPILLVLGYMEWNHQRTGYFHFSSIQNLSLLQYTTTSYLIQTEGYAAAEAIVDTLYIRAQLNPDFAAGQRTIQAGCVEILTENPGKYLVYHVKGMINFFLDPGRFDLYTFFQIESSQGGGLFDAYSSDGYAGIWAYLKKQPVAILFLLLLVTLLNALKLFALVVSVFHRKLDWIQRAILLLFVVYIAGLTGVSGASRFALPVYPLMVLGVAGAIAWGQKKWGKGDGID